VDGSINICQGSIEQGFSLVVNPLYRYGLFQVTCFSFFPA